MAIAIGASDMDLIHDAVEKVLLKVASGDLDPGNGMTAIVGWIDLAAMDNDQFLVEIRKAATA
ncbi:MAG TPA: hypothetical protein VGN68_00805 [Sphingopyxis sp.]|jgi:hypothetical protein|uniref:hypothetical protein n=1 Tax=Sphingopyxis sp. TaxID=1908224 RepID=UPI002E0F5C81|nr:hypothetical protein [Sphingopyxis sp.]